MHQYILWKVLRSPKQPDPQKAYQVREDGGTIISVTNGYFGITNYEKLCVKLVMRHFFKTQMPKNE